MGSSTPVRQRLVADLTDYTDTNAAVYLLKEALKGGAVITVGAAKEIVEKENLKADAKIGNVVKEILSRAGKAGEDQSKWVLNNTDGKWHLQAAITIGGAVYTVEFIQEAAVNGEPHFTVNIESKLEKEDSPLPGRGKLFFNPGHKATVSLKMNKDGDLIAVTKKGLEIHHDSFSPFTYQNEIIAKFCDLISRGKDTQLALAGTGSGKSIIMAGIAQSVGRTIMIVPDELLVSQQVKEVQSLHSAAKVNGVDVPKPNVFTLTSSLKGAVDDENDPDQVVEYFRKVLNGTSKPVFDQIVLQSTHPMFSVVAPLMKDQMVLIDESHTHTFKKESTDLLKEIIENNAVLALTATPTSKLYDLFPGQPMDDLSLGAAIELGNVRPIKAEVGYYEAGDLVTAGIVNYFNDYYIQPGELGYVDPVQLKVELLKKEPKPTEMEAQIQAIETALKKNRLRCLRNMAFSDDKETRDELATIYQNISEGDTSTIDIYKDAIAALRMEAEIDERANMALRFAPNLNRDDVIEQLTWSVQVPSVDLPNDIQIEQQKGIQRTVNSLALSLLFADKASTVGEKDRTHKLQAYLEKWQKDIAAFKIKGKSGAPGEEAIGEALTRCQNFNRETMLAALLKMETSIPDLPQKQKDAMIQLILDRAETVASNIVASKSSIDAVINPKDIDLKSLEVGTNYTRQIDKSTPKNTQKEIIAMLDVGIVFQLISDDTVSTGVSIKDVFNTQVTNNFSRAVEADPNVINGTLSGPQAMGRPVRHKDLKARVQQFIDIRYKDTGLILTVHDVIDRLISGIKAKEVMTTREDLYKSQMATVIQSHFRGYRTHRMFTEQLPTLAKLDDDIENCKKRIDIQTNLLKDGQKYLASTQQKLHNSEVELAFVPGHKNGRIPVEYRNKPEMVRLWAQRKDLPSVIEGIVEKNKSIEDALQIEQSILDKLVKQRNDFRDDLVEQLTEASSLPREVAIQ